MQHRCVLSSMWFSKLHLKMKLYNCQESSFNKTFNFNIYVGTYVWYGRNVNNYPRPSVIHSRRPHLQCVCRVDRAFFFLHNYIIAIYCGFVVNVLVLFFLCHLYIITIINKTNQDKVQKKMYSNDWISREKKYHYKFVNNFFSLILIFNRRKIDSHAFQSHTATKVHE